MFRSIVQRASPRFLSATPRTPFLALARFLTVGPQSTHPDVLVKNLPNRRNKSAEEIANELAASLKPLGTVVNIRFKYLVPYGEKNGDTGLIRPFGHVTFETPQEAKTAINAGSVEVGGRRLELVEASYTPPTPGAVANPTNVIRFYGCHATKEQVEKWTSEHSSSVKSVELSKNEEPGKWTFIWGKQSLAGSITLTDASVAPTVLAHLINKAEQDKIRASFRIVEEKETV